MKKILVTLFAMLLSVSVFAEGDHDAKEVISGSGFDLVHARHVLVGTVNNIPVWADKACGSHIRGMYRKNDEGEPQTFSVESIDRVLTGTFGETVVQFAGVDRENSLINLKIGETTVPVSFETESFDPEEGHFNGITWIFQNGEKEYRIHLDGEGCMGSMIFYAIFFYGMTTI